MSSDRITGKDVVLMIGGAVAGAVIPGIIGWYTGSFGVVLSFVSANPLESFLWTLLFLSLGALAGLLARGRSAKKELEAKDRELSRLRKNNRAHNALFKEFCELKHDEQLQIVSVWLSEPEGFEPSKEQRAHMGDWVKMKDFLRHAAVADRLHLVDGVSEMLLENPRKVYDLMAARVENLQRELEKLDFSEPEPQGHLEILSESESEKLILNLTDRQKEIVAEAYENGGVISGDYFDGELTQLAVESILIRPIEAYMGMPCSWTMNPTVFQFLKRNEHLIKEFLEDEGKPKYETPSVELMLDMSPVVASRVYQAYKMGEYIPISEIEPCAINSIGSKDDLFEFKQFVNPFGQPLEAKEYGLTRAWIAFLDDQTHLKQLKTIAGGWLTSEE